MVSHRSSQGLDGLARELLFSLEHRRLDSFRALWPPSGPPVPMEPMAAPIAPWSLPVVDWLAHIAAQRHHFAGALVEALCVAARSLQWRQTYSPAEIGADFLRNYAYTEILGPTAPRNSRRLSCGFLLLGPHTLYPRHRHEAEELYVTLRGDSGWLQGDAVWRQHPPGTLIHHAGGEPHAMRTWVEPLLALYVWRSADLTQTARLDTA